VLQSLRAARQPRDARELARRSNTFRFLLGVMAKSGLVLAKFARAARRGRPRQLWESTACADSPELGFRMLAEVPAGYLQTERADSSELGLEIGRSWGQQAGHSLEGGEDG
jgi:hypothetical protein